jgi:CheY-like chemotaxis protein
VAATILLIEDNDDNVEIYRTMLEHMGYRVLVAGDGVEGVRCAREEAPDLILLDILIPGIDGWDVARLLKADDRTRGIPLVAVTAQALASDRAKAEAIGMDGYFSKPIEPRQLVTEVEQFLTPAQRAS